MLFFAYWFGHYQWATTHIPTNQGEIEVTFVLYPLCQQDPLYLQSGQLLSILLVLILAITELFV